MNVSDAVGPAISSKNVSNLRDFSRFQHNKESSKYVKKLFVRYKERMALDRNSIHIEIRIIAPS